MLRFRGEEFAKGLIDSCRVWQAFNSSRTLRSIATRLLPLHATTILLGLWFHGIDRYGLYPEDWVKHAVLWTTWTVLWGTPVYVLGSLLQLRYAWLIRQAATGHQATPSKAFTSVVAETLYGALLNLTFLFQVWFINFLAGLVLPNFVAPTLQTAFSIVNVAWATAFAAFESRLITKNKDLFQRVFFVETHWAYALGYGAITSVLYHIVPSAVSNGLWQYALLLLMLNAMRLKLLSLPEPRTILPPTEEEGGGGHGRRRRAPRVCEMDKQLRYRLRVFYVAQLFAIYVMQQFNTFLRAFGNHQPKPQPSSRPRSAELEDNVARQPPNLLCESWECPVGWQALLDNFAAEVNAQRQHYRNNGGNSVVVSFNCIKSKFGALRIQGTSARVVNSDTNETDSEASQTLCNEVNKLAEDVEKASTSVCEKCGAPGVLGSSQGWYATLCIGEEHSCAPDGFTVSGDKPEQNK